MKTVLLLSFSLMAFYACDKAPEKLILINDTENAVYYQLHTDTVPFVYANYDPKTQYEQYYLLYPNDTVRPLFVMGGKGAWAYKINKEAVDSALHIFILSTYQITDEIIKNREYERLSFTVKELDLLNWTVVYRGQNKIKEDADECSP